MTTAPPAPEQSHVHMACFVPSDRLVKTAFVAHSGQTTLCDPAAAGRNKGQRNGAMSRNARSGRFLVESENMSSRQSTLFDAEPDPWQFDATQEELAATVVFAE